MEHVTQSTNPSTPRDYDKEPIVIEDYNPQFMWLSFKYILFPLLIVVWIILTFYFPDKRFDWSKLLIFIPIASWPAYRQYKNTKGKRKIFLYKNTICYKHDDQLITDISFDKSPKFYRSFQNFYHKSQSRLKIWHFVLFFLMGVLITKSFTLNMLIFFFAFGFAFISFQIIKSFISTAKSKFYHSVLVIEEDEVISIPLLKQDDYVSVEKYFAMRGIAMNTFPVIHKVIYGYENIEINEGK